MDYHIHYLEDTLILMALVFPGSLNSIIKKPQRSSFKFSMVSTIAVYIVLITFTLMIKMNEFLFFNNPSWVWYLVAPLFGFLCIAIEYMIGAVQIYIQQGKFPKRFAVHSYYSVKIDLMVILLIITLVVLEELILRQAIFTIFFNGFQFQVWLVIALSALIYGLNHIFFGLSIVPQKIMSGVIFALLYYYSGLALVIPFLAHLTQNLTLLKFSDGNSLGGRK